MTHTVRNFSIWAATVFATSVLSAVIHAHDDESLFLVDIIKAIESDWEQADGKPFRAHYLNVEGARYIESGGQNTGLTDLIEHHVEPEGDALDNLDLTFSNNETHIEGEFAWAIVDLEVIAVLKGNVRRIHNRGYETFLFRRVGDEWNVVHTHSSTRPVADKTEMHHQAGYRVCQVAVSIAAA